MSPGPSHAEIALVPFGKKWLRSAPLVKVRCEAAFNGQKREGDLPQNTDPADLARYVMTFLEEWLCREPAAPVAINRFGSQMALRVWPKR
jgi:hypothetical protein